MSSAKKGFMERFRRSEHKTSSDPQLIYELQTASRVDVELVQASLEAMQEVGFPLTMTIGKSGGGYVLEAKTTSSDQGDLGAQSALLMGVVEAAGRRVRLPTRENESGISQYHGDARAQADNLLKDYGNHGEGMYPFFKEYYGGLRWGTDQEKFVRALFIHSAEFDPKFLEKHLTGGQVSNLTYHLDVDIPYGQREKWYQTPVVEIFRHFPQLDYRRLTRDKAFSESVEGQKLLKAYSEMIGDMLASQNKRGERMISPDGEQLKRPPVPLSRFPIIEALMTSEIALDQPREKYFMGPHDVVDIILDSDSELAHQVLVDMVNTRLSERSRWIFDGPDEFEHKHRIVASLIHLYKEFYRDEARRNQLRKDLVQIMDNYTGKGEVAVSVRQENAQKRSRGLEGDTGEVHEVKDIVSSLLTAGMTSPDVEISGRVASIVSTYLPAVGRELARYDPLALTRGDLMLVIIDAVQMAAVGSRPEVFRNLATLIFADRSFGESFSRIASFGIEADRQRNTPSVLKALRNWRRFDVTNDRDPEAERARAAFNRFVKPANELVRKQTSELHELIFKIINQQIVANTWGNAESSSLVAELIPRVELGVYDMSSLPEDYHRLVNLAKHPRLAEEHKKTVLWHFQKQFEYVGAKGKSLLVSVVFDMLEIALGPSDQVVLPTRETRYALGAVTSLIDRHGRDLFKFASEKQLRELARYVNGFQERARQIAAGALIADGKIVQINPNVPGITEWQKEALENLRGVMGEFEKMSKYYSEFLRIEAVKVFPHVYYPWVLEKLVPFWRKMQWEVGPGNIPSGEIVELYRILESYIKSKLVIMDADKYPESFDVIGQGQIDGLLRECYQRMQVPHDIKYNTTVWQEGLPFLYHVIGHMPKTLLDKIIAKHSGTGFAVFLKEVHEERNKEEDVR